MKRTRQSGFTLVEILIVVIILGILAAIIIPQFTNASTQARDNTLSTNIQSLQSQFELYKTQHNDQYPWDADADPDVTTLDTAANIVTKMTTVTGVDGLAWAAGDKCGPYLATIPANPYTGHTPGTVNSPGTVTFAAATGGANDWAIDVNTGAVSDGR